MEEAPEGARKANREDVLHAGEHMLGGGAKQKGVRGCTGETHWGGQDKMGRAKTRTRYRTEGAGWMDGRAESACEFVCPFRRERPPARIDSALSFGY